MPWLAVRSRSEVDKSMLNRKIEGDSIVFYDGTNRILTIGEAQTDEGILLTLAGELRTETAHDIQDEMIALTTVGANIVVDMAGVTYISSSVQHVFLTVQKKTESMNRGALTLRNLPEAVYQEFYRTGVSELLMIDD